MKPRSFKKAAKRILRSTLSVAALAVIFGAAQAASYTSPPLVNDFSGRGCAGCGADADIDYAPFTNETGWLGFFPNSNPIPGLLLSIDPSFSTKYRVDSLTLTFKAAFASSPEDGVADWTFMVSDGLGGPTDTFPVQIANYQIQSFNITAANASFERALDGGLRVQLVDTTVGIDNLSLFNIKAYANYSDLAPPVPEPSEWAMLVVGLTVIGFIGSRRKQKMT
jgi:hypothetical protein